ncbi:hypothetical protein [Arthrobacter globiformis]|uniref:hypothetical protein n=1 Tax=Arthrobacter globiformis TaxID=1665 RepID=UPI00278B6B8B|nr:hypothetical protein [Arthrobacter globiformis]MDQ0863132.1 hypothetical protein [Arthrobacter globiformis]
MADLTPPSSGFSGSPAIVIKPFSGTGLRGPDFPPIPALPARENSHGRVLIEPFNRGARLIG